MLPNAHVHLLPARRTADYGGTLTFDDGTIRIQTYEPFSATMKSRFRMNGRRCISTASTC